MICASTQTKSDFTINEARFVAVDSGSEENKELFEDTANGKLVLVETKEQHFEVDKEYYIDISLAE